MWTPKGIQIKMSYGIDEVPIPIFKAGTRGTRLRLN